MGDTEGEIQVRNDLQRAGEYIQFDYSTDMGFSIPEHRYVIQDASFTASSRINSLDWSFDGRYLASASDDGTVRVWNPDTGENLTTITIAPGAWVGSAAWRPNSLELAYGNLDGTVTILVPDNVVPVLPNANQRVTGVSKHRIARTVGHEISCSESPPRTQPSSVTCRHQSPLSAGEGAGGEVHPPCFVLK